MPTAVYRIFAARMLAAALVACVLLGAAAWVYEKERIDDAIVAMAMQEARSFAATRDSPEPVTKRLADFLAQRGHHPDGHFVLAEVYGDDRAGLAEASGPDAAPVERVFDRHAHRFPGPDGQPVYDTAPLGTALYLRVMTRLDGGGYFEGIYRVADERLADLRGGVLVTVGLVVAVVLTTTLILLPAVVTFNRRLVALSTSLMRANVETLELLGGAIAKRDSDTNAHNYRVTLYAVRLAEAVGLDTATIRALIKGAFLHDVGKIAIPDAILLKPGKLTEDEFAEMKTHVLHGDDIVTRSRWLDDAKPVVLHHHEKYDGSGYPSGLKGQGIPVIARVFAIADVFDALTSRRPYKPPFPFGQALDMMREQRGRHFDPALLDAFERIADGLHAAYAGHEEADLAAELVDATRRYFDVG